MASIGVCPYCHEPTGKTELGFLMAVHPEHQAGTPHWARWYRRERDAGRYRSRIGDLLLSVAESKMAGAGAGLAKMQALNRERVAKEQASNPGIKKVNPGLLKMQEMNRLRKLQKEKSGV